MVGTLATLFDQANVSPGVAGSEANAVPEIRPTPDENNYM